MVYCNATSFLVSRHTGSFPLAYTLGQSSYRTIHVSIEIVDRHRPLPMVALVVKSVYQVAIPRQAVGAGEGRTSNEIGDGRHQKDGKEGSTSMTMEARWRRQLVFIHERNLGARGEGKAITHAPEKHILENPGSFRIFRSTSNVRGELCLLSNGVIAVQSLIFYCGARQSFVDLKHQRLQSPVLPQSCR